jgi:uncharacterized coiled-coil DUF342 family protein
MTPSEHDKRQAESDAGMEQWEEGRAQRLRAFSEVMTEFPTIHRELVAAADHIDALRAKIKRLRAEVATLRRKADLLDRISGEHIHDVIRLLREYAADRDAAEEAEQTP